MSLSGNGAALTTTGRNNSDALIVGAGPVGRSLAIELGSRGSGCLVVGRNDRGGLSPRAKTTNVRTREHLRRWGIADALRNASPIPADFPPNVVFATRMNGPLLARFENAFNGCRERNDLYSEEAQWVPQYTLEEVLRSHAVGLPGVTLAFETEIRSLTQRDDGVSAEVVDLRTGTSRRIDAAYLVGADGARSHVREAIGARMTGDDTAMSNYSIIFRAPDLMARQSHGKAIMYWMVNGDVPALLGPMDQDGLWFFMATKLPDGFDVMAADGVDLIRRGTGLAGLDIEVVRGDPWTARSLVADIYSRGRVFLAGDACHLHPPFGGFGMNMGIGDGVDLGWKIAATLQGWGGPGLLASYASERRPVHELTIHESVANYAVVGNQLVRPGIEDPGAAGDATRREVGDLILATKIREFKTLGLVLGSRYVGSPILASEHESESPPPFDSTIYVPSGSPGCLAPHLWLGDGSSLYDHFGSWFTLLAMDGDETAAEAVLEVAERHRIPLKLVMPGDARLPDLYRARFAIIRPDQYVAWRGNSIPRDVATLLMQVTGNAASAHLD